MVIDPEINIQPNTSNPHTIEDDEPIELSNGILEQARAHATSEFERSKKETLARVAYVSQKLEQSYQDDGIFRMAEVGPSGVNAVAIGDGSKFFVDTIYDPEHVEEQFSPLSQLEKTGYDTELGLSIANYQVMDLSNADVEPITEVWSAEGVEELEATYLVAPGMQDGYNDAIN